jgi:hypothetical protein
MAAEVFGIDNLKSYIETYKNITNVHIYAFSNSKKSVASAICSRDNGDLLEQVETYLNLSASGENSTKTYYILLKAENKNKEVDVVGFTFSMESKTASLAVNGPSHQAPAENNRINDLYYQLGDMQRHNNQLQAENQELKQELAILQENAEISGIEDPLEKYMPYIAPMLGKLFGLENTPVNGVNSDIELSNIIAELQNIDPDFKNNMFLLLKLAKNKPMIYKMAVKQLTSL